MSNLKTIIENRIPNADQDTKRKVQEIVQILASGNTSTAQHEFDKYCINEKLMKWEVSALAEKIRVCHRDFEREEQTNEKI